MDVIGIIGKDALSRCVGGLYVIDESDFTVVYANEYITRRYGNIIGRHCYEIFHGKTGRCGRCPDNLSCEQPYLWEDYDTEKKKWLRVKNVAAEADGKRYRIANVESVDDIMLLSRDSVRQMAYFQNLLRDNERMKDLLEWNAGHDAATGLCNRGKYLADAKNKYSEAAPLGIHFYDVNYLKKTNDTYGHEAGDALIKKAADAVAEAEGDGVIAYRMGGDEFAVVCNRLSREQFDAVAEKIDRALAEANTRVPFPQCELARGSIWHDTPVDIDDIMSAADEQMYSNKLAMKAARK